MRLLVYEPSYRRLEARFDAFGRGLEPLLLNDTGEIHLAGQLVPHHEIACEAAWASQDLFGSPVVRLFMKFLLESPGLRWLQSGAAGFDHPIFGQIVQQGTRLTTSHGQALGIAEYVLAGVLDALQRGSERRAAQAGRRWERLPFREVNRSNWLIVGFGAIGKAVADRARAFGAHVTGVRRATAPDASADRIASLADLPALLPESDVVVLCCPLTAETQHLANAAFFSAIKQDAIFVNVGRGGLVDEQALLAALDRGELGRAVLDVFQTEPLPPDSPFWAHPRISLTPHASGMSNGNAPRNDEIFLENLRRYLAGEALLNEVSKETVLAER